MALALLLAATAPAAVVSAGATSSSYEMELDESGIGGGTSSSGNAQLRGSAVTMMHEQGISSGGTMLIDGFAGSMRAFPNADPVLDALTLTTAVDTAVSGTVTASDADDEPLLYGVGSPMPGTMQSFAPATGAFTWLPPSGASGSYDLPVTVTDGFGAAVTGHVTVVVVTPLIVVAPSSTLFTSESGGQSSFTIVLSAQPLGPVTVPVTSNRPTEVTVSVASVSFTTSDWSNARTVTLTGQPDGVADGDQTCQIQVGPAVGPGTIFDGLSGTPVTVINIDQDSTPPVNETKPWIDSRPSVEVAAGDLLEWTMHVDTTDLTSPVLSFSTVGAPAGLVLVPNAGAGTAELSWTPPINTTGDVTFTVIVTDSVSNTAASQVVTLYVRPLPAAAL